MKSKFIASCLLTFSVSLSADSLSGSVFYGTDSDVDVFKISTSGFVDIKQNTQIGASLTQGRISGFDSTRVGLLANIKNGDFVFTADAGLESHGNEFTTLVEANYNQKNFILGAFAQRDIVDSKSGMQDFITFDVVGVSAELMNDKMGIVGGFSSYNYEDDTTKDLFNAKVYYSFLDGFNCFASTQHYTTSKHSNYFFSPESYDRHLIGVGTRQKVFDGVLSAQLATGVQKVNDDSNEKSDFFKIGYDKKLTNAWQLKSEYIYDKKQPDYAYRQTFISLTYKF